MSGADDQSIDLGERFPDLEPINSAPSVWNIYGFGLGLYGSRDEDPETYSFVKTHSISALGIPIFALAAYRVAVVDNSVYILGRHPLSSFAKMCNCLLVSGIVCAAIFGAWTSYTNSPDYLASQKLVEADQLLSSGETTRAAQLYRDVAVGTTSHTAAAREKFRGLLDGPLRAAPPDEAVKILLLAANMHKQAAGSVDTALLLEVGSEHVEKTTAVDPRGALAMLNAIAPLIDDADELAAKRQKLLETLVKQHPDDSGAATQLALVYEQQGEIAKIEALLAPHRDRLGTLEGARLLGQIYARKGEHEQAVGLLLPYTQARLKRLHAAEKALERTFERAQQQIIDKIQNGAAPQSFYDRANKLGQDEQDVMVWEYIQNQMKDDPLIEQRRQALIDETPVVPVALDLGIALLQHSQAMADPAARRSELEQAEKIFLAIRGVAGESDEYRLSLGQVYYWLGKQKEGRELFDELLDSNDRRFELLMAVSNTVRDVGLFSDSRTLSEEAYGKAANDEQKHQAAALRAITSFDLDDKIVWLGRGNQSHPDIKAGLSSSKASQAIRDGNDAQAVKHLQTAIDIYSAQTDTQSTLNNAALACFSMYQLTGDVSVLDDGISRVEKALAIDPSDSILLHNAASVILEGGIRDVIGDTLDMKLLKSSSDTEMLSYLYPDQSGRQPLIDRVNSNLRISKALRYFQKVLVLAPKRYDTYVSLAAIYDYTRDTNALRDLLRRIEEADPDLSESIQQTLDYYAGKDDETLRQSVDSSIVRWETILTAAKPQGGATLAIAETSLIGQLLTANTFGRDVNTDRIMDLAEQAYAQAPSARTHAALVSALCFRGGQKLADQQPAYAKLLSKAERSLGHNYVLAVALSREGRLREAALASADVQRATELLAGSMDKFPDEYGLWEWVMLRAAQPQKASKLAEIIRRNEVRQVMQQISERLSPASGRIAYRASWAAQLAGDDVKARDALRQCAERGVPLPLEAN